MDASELSKTFFARNPTDYSVDDNWQFLKAGLIEILDKRVPKKKVGTWSDTPWITRDLKRLLWKKKRLHNIYKNTYNSDDKHKYRKFQKYVKVKLRKAQDDYLAESLNIDPKDKPKKIWSYIKAKRQDQIGIPPLKSDVGLKVDSRGKAETLNAQFQKVFTQEDVSSIPNKGLPSIISISRKYQSVLDLRSSPLVLD